jgi:hypothetical protein
MASFNYMASAELFPSKNRSHPGTVRYRRFNTAAEAVQFAVEEMPEALLRGSLLEVDEKRYDGSQIRKLYDAEDFPLVRQAA